MWLVYLLDVGGTLVAGSESRCHMTTFTLSHRFRARTLGWLAAVAWLSTSIEAFAQTSRDIEWQPGTTLGVFVGANGSAANTAPVAGTALGFELTPHFTIEGRGTWLRHDHGLTDFSASINALIPLLRPRAVVPFALAGFGMHGATVDPRSSDLPAFYRDRLPPNEGRPVFEDLLLTFGGGIDVFLTSHLALRPEVTMYVITTRHDHLTKAVYGVHLAYHFEEQARP
jgi:hypothetical protein